VALNLYRRHRRECKAGYSEQDLSSEFEERKRGWKRCECPIVVSGTLRKKFKRVSTGQWEWSSARVIAAKWETAGSWDNDISAPGPVVTVPTAEELITIERACKAFLAEREETLSANTFRKNDYVLKSVQNYAAWKGYVLIAQWTPIDVRELRTSWGVAPNTATKYMEIVKSFFSFAVANKWIVESPARLIKGAKGKAANNQRERIPFSDEELQRMYDACEHQYGKTPIRWSRDVHHRPAGNEFANYRYKWIGEDLADFISVSTYTGLRISDVATFHIDRLQANGECHVRTTKTGRKVYTWIPEWLQQRIRARVVKHGPFIFGAHETTNINVITDLWRRKLNRLWDLCGPWKSKPHPHRFRHTFARILLQKPSVTVRDVAELLGDTEDVILKHYGAWVPERQERLSRVLQEAFAEKPKPKIVAITPSKVQSGVR
jgi:integrase